MGRKSKERWGGYATLTKYCQTTKNERKINVSKCARLTFSSPKSFASAAGMIGRCSTTTGTGSMAPLAKRVVLTPLKRARFGSVDRSANNRVTRGQTQTFESKASDSGEFGSEGYVYEEMGMSEKERGGAATPGRIEVLVERQVHTATVWDTERAKNQNHAL